MQRTLLTILSVLFCAITFAQSVPQGINYQAVARDANGDVLMNQALTIQFSVISDITTGNVSWQETHQDTTNDYGLFTAIIGQGTSTSVGSSATFDVIDWGASNHLLKVEVDYGSGFVDMGTTAFMSVPYSISSKYADNVLNISGISHRDFSNDIPNTSPGWYCIATLNDFNNQGGGDQCRGLFSIWNNSAGKREQITFYAGISYSRGAFLDIVSHNCYGYNGCEIDSIKIESSNNWIYDYVNIYVYRNPSSSYSSNRIAVGLNNYLSPTTEPNISEWILTPNAMPISSEKNLICDLTKTKNVEPYSYTTLNKNFQGSVSRSTAVLEDDDLTTKQYVDSRNDSLESLISTLDSLLNSVTPSSVTYSIGDIAQGGIVFYVSPDGKNGLVAATVDQSTSSNWYNASDVISIPLNHTLQGQKFLDWRLPTLSELYLMYSNIGQGNALGLGNIGGFASGTYWSSTENDTNSARNQNFLNGYQLLTNKDFPVNYVRAIRAF